MTEFLIRRVEAMIATLDFSKGTKEPILEVRSELNRTSDGGVFQLTVNGRRYLISVEECED